MLLNKTAEKVLKCIIKKSKGNPEQSVHISWKDFKDKRITNSFINSLCRQLKEEEYIYNAYLSCNENETIEVYLSYKGFSYFDNKRTKMFWRLFPIIISLIALIKSFQQELVLLIQLIMKSTK